MTRKKIEKKTDAPAVVGANSPEAIALAAANAAAGTGNNSEDAAAFAQKQADAEAAGKAGAVAPPAAKPTEGTPAERAGLAHAAAGGVGVANAMLSADLAGETIRQRAMDPKLVDDIFVMVQKPYQITLDNRAVVKIAAGPQTLPRFIAEHHWSRANGVKPYEVQRAPGVHTITDKVYDDAAANIKAGAYDVSYAVPQIAGFYNLKEAEVRKQLEKRIA